MQFWPSIAWTTLALTINADGTSSHELVGASPFPRHWIYDDDGKLVQKSGVIDFNKWFNNAFGDRTPWGEVDSPAVVAEVESALERSLSGAIMRGDAKPKIRSIAEGEALVTQGEAGTDVFLVLDGMFTVEVDGEPVSRSGPVPSSESGRASSTGSGRPRSVPGRRAAWRACRATPWTPRRWAASLRPIDTRGSAGARERAATPSHE